MVFSSIPAYLDPPNWHQQPNQHQANGTHSLLPPLPVPPQPHAPHGAGSIRPGPTGPTLDQAQAQAQLAKIAPSEVALKCPRCESTNTKFCYFNNYSLSQPRHFCKTCRRYWTRGGALRNVPVGGGCRRNKKSKRSSSSNTSTRSESPLSTDHNHSSVPSNSVTNNELIPTTNRPFMTSLQNLSRYGVGNIGLSLREIQAQTGHVGCQTAEGGAMDEWRFQQIPFLNGYESSSTVSYPFQPSGLVGEIAEASRVTQLPSVKLEYNGGRGGGGINLLSRSSLSITENNHYNSWTTDLSALASSSASHHLL